jgi:hypothetical protein
MRLQNMSVTSSRAAVRSTWTRLASSVSRLASSFIFDRSATSVTRACPAKCPIFPGGMPCSHTSAGPSASSSSMCWSRCLNFPRAADCAGALSASKPLRRVAGSTTISRSSPARCAGPIRAATAVKKPRLTWVRMVLVASSKVE